MQSKKKRISSEKRDMLLKAVGKVIHSRRKECGKGILLLSYEYDLSSNSLERIEKGLRDPQLTTIWKIVDALGMTFDEFIVKVKSELPDGFVLIDSE